MAEKGGDVAHVGTAGGTVSVKKTFGLVRSIAFIVGSIIGSGIFVSPQGVTSLVGSSGLSLIIWLVCGIISGLSALCYAELGILIPESGEGYPYMKHAYGRPLAFLQGWLSMTITGPSGIAIMSITCANYLLAPLFEDACETPPSLLVKLLSATIIIVVVAINCYSSSIGADINVAFTITKLVALAIIIIGGLVRLGQGYTEHLSNGFEGSSATPGSVALSLYVGMWAYTGWSALNFVTEEIKDPARNLPLSVIIGLTVVVGIYVLVNVSYFTVLSPEELVRSPAVAIVWTRVVLPDLVWLMSIFIAFSTAGAAVVTLFASSRVFFVCARDKNVPQILSFVHVTRRTPFISTVVSGILSICYVIPVDIGGLLNIFGFTYWLTVTIVFTTIIILRYKKPYSTMERAFRVPTVIVILSIAIGLYCLIAPLTDGVDLEMLYALAFILAGFILYVPFVHFGLVLPGTDSVSTFLQLVMQVAPPPQFILEDEHRKLMMYDKNDITKDINGHLQTDLLTKNDDATKL